MHPEPATLFLHCVHCGGLTELQFEDWDPGLPEQKEAWSCPWCSKLNLGTFPGRLAWAMKFYRTVFPH